MKKVEEKGEGLLYRKIHSGIPLRFEKYVDEVLDEARNFNPFNPLREAIIIYRNLENHTEEQKQIIIEEHLKNCNLVKWVLEEIEWFEKWFGDTEK